MTKNTDRIYPSSQVRRNYKDSLFRKLFADKEDALELYNALNGLSYQDSSILEITTIEDVIYMNVKNDLAFLIDGKMHLLEVQSSWSPNMPLRGLLYFAGLYQGYVSKNQLDIYSRTRLVLPKPVYIVFYNGEKELPERMELRLSDSFETDGDISSLEVVAHVFNINYGKNRQLMERCQRLHDYAYLLQRIRHYRESGLTLIAAVDKAVEACIREGVMKEFLLKHRGEVTDIILTEYNAELHINSEKKLSFEEGQIQGHQEGHQEGRQEGRQEGIHALICDNMKENIPKKRIMEKLQRHFDLSPEEAQGYMAQFETQKE